MYELPDVSSRDGGFLGLLGSKEKNLNVKNVYLDPVGYHCIITLDMNNNLYLNYKDSKIRPITRLKGIPIKALGFHSSGTESKSGYILFSSENAVISLLRLEIAQG